MAKALGDYLNHEEFANEPNLCVWTSNMLRSRETAAEIKCKRLVEWRALREIEVSESGAFLLRPR
jgi:broad specificity phosphatase PhoE